MTNDLMWTADGFEHAQRLAKMFASSTLVPDHMRGKVADVTIAVLMAHRLREDPLVLMQQMQVIKGKNSFASTYVISRINRSGLIRGRVMYRVEGSGKTLAVTAYAIDEGTGNEVAETITMAMAEADGWASNSKYKTMPERMLKYRAVTALMRLHYPEVMLGIPLAEELEDEAAASASKPQRQRVSLADIVDAELAVSEAPALPDHSAAEAIEQAAPAQRETVTVAIAATTDDEDDTP